MEDVEKIIKGWERCLKCEKAPIGMSQAYVDCEYTIGLYCGRDKLICATIRALKEQQQKKEPMKLLYEKFKEEYWGIENICPVCDCHWMTGSSGKENFCPHCGQPVIDNWANSQSD